MRNLDQDPGAITGILLAAAGAAMHEVPEYGQCVRHDSMRTASLDVHDETDTTGVVLVSRVIKTLLHLLVKLFQFRSPFHSPLAVIPGTSPLGIRRSADFFRARQGAGAHFREMCAFARETCEKH